MFIHTFFHFRLQFGRVENNSRHIDQQWFNGEFTNWQVYHNPPGFANTNSNIESVNNDFKRFFTNRKRLSMKGAIEIIGKCIIYNSENSKVFETKPKLSRRLLTTANSIPIKEKPL